MASRTMAADEFDFIRGRMKEIAGENQLYKPKVEDPLEGVNKEDDISWLVPGISIQYKAPGTRWTTQLCVSEEDAKVLKRLVEKSFGWAVRRWCPKSPDGHHTFDVLDKCVDCFEHK